MTRKGTESERGRSANGKPGDSTRREYPVNLPATIEIGTSVMTAPFSIEGAAICGVSRGGLGLMLTLATTVTREDFAKLLARRRTCFISCTPPGSDRQLRLFGTIVWTKPKRTAEGTDLRFGVSLEGADSRDRQALEAFLESAKDTG